MARGKASGDGMNKMDLVRRALEALPTGTPKQLQVYIKQQAGVDIKAQMISSYKSQLRRKGVEGADTTVALRDLTTLSKLIEKMGAPQVQQLVKVLSK